MSRCLALLVVLCAALPSASARAAQCERPTVDATGFNIAAPCVLFNGQRYDVGLLPIIETGGVGWALDPSRLGVTTCTASVPHCGVLDSALGLTFRDIDFAGAFYTLRLAYRVAPAASGMPAWDYGSHHVLRPSATIGTSCGAASGTQTVSFVHVGDLHANFDLVKDKYSRIRAYYERVKAENTYTIFTNAGDDHEKGSVAEPLSQGLAVIEATEAMRFDVRTLGNHDFAWGDSHLLNFSRDANGGMVLSSNTSYVGTGSTGLGSVDFGIVEAGCLRIGFFGLVSPPWNELDVIYEEDYFPTLRTRFDYSAVAKQIVDAHRGEVDLMVMVSHLGFGDDKRVAAAVPGIDLVLGGHTHGGPQVAQVGSTLVLQPDFYGDGVTRVDVDVDLATRAVSATRRTEQPVVELSETDATVRQLISSILSRYAPAARTSVGYLESGQSGAGIVALAAKAGIAQLGADAALLKPDLIHPTRTWSAGEISAQTIIDSYMIERQKPNTPGISSMYLVEVTGGELAAMVAAQPTWTYSGPASPAAATTYKLLLNKGAALNPATYFSTIGPRNATFKSETWEVLKAYAATRTANCLSLDTDSPPPGCRSAAAYTVWNFANSASPLSASSGSATLSYRDNTNSGWGASNTVFSTSAALGLPALADGHHAVMSFPSTTPDQGYLLTHGASANGGYASSGLVSNYSIIMDILWPSASDAKWRALLQTSSANDNDADWYVKNAASGGIGIQSYFGALEPNRWYRIAMVASAADSGGSLKFYIDGALAGEKTSADSRWALGSTALLLADDNYETEKGYLANLLFAPFVLTETEIQNLGGASSSMSLASP